LQIALKNFSFGGLKVSSPRIAKMIGILRCRKL